MEHLQYLTDNWLTVASVALGVAYVFLEYKASIWVWAAGIVIPVFDICLYWNSELYANSAVSCYYIVAAIYGFICWYSGRVSIGNGRKEPMPVTHLVKRLIAPMAGVFFVLWVAIAHAMGVWSSSPFLIADGFVAALSFVAIWCMAQKFVEHWLFWAVADAVGAILYALKGFPLRASLYALFVVVCVFGYRKWKTMIEPNETTE